MNSLQEAAYHGVPIIGTPVGFDQYDNVIRGKRFGFGEVINTKTITNISIVVETMIKVIENPSYLMAAKNISLKTFPCIIFSSEK